MAKKSKRPCDGSAEAPDDREPAAVRAEPAALTKSRRRGDGAAEAQDDREPAAARAEPGAPRKSRRRGGDAATPSQGTEEDAGTAASGSEEGKKPKLKKQKKNRGERCPSAVVSDADATAAGGYGNVCSDVEGGPVDAQFTTSSTVAEDPSCLVGSIVEKGTPDRKKPKLKKSKKNREERSPSHVASGRYGNDCAVDDQGAPGDRETSMRPGNGAEADCPQVSIAEVGTPQRKKTKLKKRRKNKQEQSPVPDSYAVEADKSGNVCMDVEGASGDADVSMSPTNREDPDRLGVNIGEKGTQERKRKKRKNKQEQSPSAVLGAGDVVGDKSGHDSTNVEAESQDADINMIPRSGADPKCPEVNMTEDSMDGNKDSLQKSKREKRKKNKQEQCASAVLGFGDFVADKSGHDSTNVEAADATMILRGVVDPKYPEVNITEDSVVGNKDNLKKSKREKRKKNKQDQSASSVLGAGDVVADKSGHDSTNVEAASQGANVTMIPRSGADPKCPGVNMTEDSMDGNKENLRKSKREKRKKNKQEQCASAVLGSGDVVADKSGHDSRNVEAASQGADVTMILRGGVDPKYPEVNITEDSVVGNKDNLKKSKREKRKKNKKDQSASSVLGTADVVADKSGHDSTNVEAASQDADATMIPRSGADPKCPGVNIAEDSVEENKDNIQKSKREKRKKKKKKQEQSASAVLGAGDVAADKSGHESTNLEAASASQDADVTMIPISGVDPKCPGVNIAEDSVDGNKDNFQKSKPKKRKKNKQEKSGNCCKNEEVVSPGDADVSTSPRKENDPNLPKAPEDPVVDACWTDSVGKIDDIVSEVTANKEITKSMGPSICESEVTANIVSLTLVQDVAKAKDVLSDDKKITENMEPTICESEVTANNVPLTLVQDVAKAKDVCPSARSDKSGSLPILSSSGGNNNEKVQDIYSPQGSLVRFQRKKLLILDLNGLLADINKDYHNAHLAHAKVRGKLVFKRPYYDDFLRFCLQKFELAVWSSRMKINVDSVVNILMKDLKQHLLFCWDLSKCTTTGFNTLENQYKPLVLKELKKLWNKEVPGLPWEHGEFSPSNTLLVDDSPYKALRNPPHTAIFPYPYSYHNKKDDSLGPGGDLRVYLENLAAADDVQSFVQENPFGQPSISESDPHWNFYVGILDKFKKPVA